MTALQNVVIAYHLHTGMNPFQQFIRDPRTREKEKALEEAALGTLELVGIGHVKDEIAGKLPHGYQEALALAMAMATKPKLLLLDEPVTGMNPVETAEMMERIKELNERGVTILLVDHDMRAVMGTCKKLTAMNFGQKIAEGSAEEVSRNKDVIEAYLGVGEV
jgi:branched-chain amino acid transport system ATP-binding protein